MKNKKALLLRLKKDDEFLLNEMKRLAKKKGFKSLNEYHINIVKNHVLEELSKEVKLTKEDEDKKLIKEYFDLESFS